MKTAYAKPLVMIGVPTNGEHSFFFSQSVQGMVFPTNFSMQITYVPFMEVGRARNILVQYARDRGAKFLLFWDEDVIADANGLRRLIYHMLNHDDWSVCGGVYASKTVPPEPLLYNEWAMGSFYGWKKGEMVHTRCIGNGFTLFRVADFDRIGQDVAPYYEDRNPFDGSIIIVQNFFNSGDGSQLAPGSVNKTMWTEDMYFFQMAEAAGMQVWADTSIALHHYNKVDRNFYDVPIDGNMAIKPDAWNHSPLVCNLGGVGEYSPYEVSVDLRDDPFVTYRCDIRNLPDDWTDKFDLVKSHHTLEHFPFKDTEKVFGEWVRIVKPGGKMSLILPDLTYAARLIAHDEALDTYLLGNIFGDQGHEYWGQEPYGEVRDGKYLPWSFENNCHKAGFTPRFTQLLFEKYGLVDIKIERHDHQFLIEGTKQGVNNGDTQPESTIIDPEVQRESDPPDIINATIVG